jgi:hypothetical protein
MPPDSKPTTIFFSIRNGFAARMLLRSDVLNLLKDEGYRVVILLPQIDETIRHEFEDKTVKVEKIKTGYDWLEWRWKKFGYYLFGTIHQTETNVIRKATLRQTNIFQYFLVNTLGKSKSLYKLWLSSHRFLFKDRYNAQLFRIYDPALVVTTTFGRDYGDLLLLTAAKKRGIHTLCIVESWDNLSSKCHLFVRPDRLIVWNQINKKEAIQLFDYTEEQVDVVGVPHFDTYARMRFISREEWAVRLGVDPKRKTILLAGSSGAVVNEEFDEIVAILAKAIESNYFPFPTQLLIRPHPHVYSGYQKGKGTFSDFQRYRTWSRHIYYDIPSLTEGSIKTNLATDSIEQLGNTLYHCDVVLNFFSTIALESCIVGTPAIGIGFDGIQHKPYSQSVRRFKDYTHFKPLIEMGAVTVAEDSQSLLKQISTYLLDPNLHYSNRKKAADLLCYKCDGKASERMFVAIKKCVENAKR